MMRNDPLLLQLGARLRAERKKAGLSQDVVAKALSQAGSSGHAYVSRLESGKVGDVGFLTVTRYLRTCKAPIGKFMLELAQSGAFGEAEQGLTVVVEDKLKEAQAKRAKAKLLYQKRWEREAQDSAIIVRLWSEVMPAIQSLLPSDPSRRLMAPYLEGVRAMYRAWKQAVRGAVNRDPTPDVQMVFDRIEQAGLQRLVPAAVHKMREIVFDRLMAMTPQSGST
jgi:transcriptional regulator with XRE-family HTH domain